MHFIRRAIAPVIGWLGNPAGFHFRPSADVGLAGAVAEAIERVFLGLCGHADQIGSVAVGAEGDQIAGVTSGTFDTMADAASHRSGGMHAAGQREYLAVRDEWENDEIGAGRDELTGMSNRNTRSGFWGSWCQVNRKRRIVSCYEKCKFDAADLRKNVEKTIR
jgi:hypothetical protein